MKNDDKSAEKKYSKFFRAVMIAVFSTVILALIGVAKLFGYQSPKMSTIVVNFCTILMSSWLVSIVMAAMNKGFFMKQAETAGNGGSGNATM